MLLWPDLHPGPCWGSLQCSSLAGLREDRVEEGEEGEGMRGKQREREKGEWREEEGRGGERRSPTTYFTV